LLGPGERREVLLSCVDQSPLEVRLHGLACYDSGGLGVALGPGWFVLLAEGGQPRVELVDVLGRGCGLLSGLRERGGQSIALSLMFAFRGLAFDEQVRVLALQAAVMAAEVFNRFPQALAGFLGLNPGSVERRVPAALRVSILLQRGALLGMLLSLGLAVLPQLVQRGLERLDLGR
jgi:hypothetical protein